MPSWAQLTEEQLQDRRLVGISAETVHNVTGTDIPGAYGPEQDDSWDLDRFANNLKVQFHQNKPYDAQFSLIRVDASIANAFRRILIAEIPTLAIEDIYMFNNTSIIQDEVLSHRLGLIPLTGGKEGLRWLKNYKKPPPKDDYAAQAVYNPGDADTNETVPTDENTVIMSLEVECRWADPKIDGRDGRALAKAGETDPNLRYVNSNVYAHQFEFQPQGQQTTYFSGENAIRPVNPDILIAKLRPGQRIHCQCHAIKSIGSDHAKFSPVATASYRLLPHINITKPILGEEAKKFARCFPKGVIEFPIDPETGVEKAVVMNPMKDTVSREVLRHDEFKDKVKLGRIRDHFIFSVESTGQLESDELFLESVRVLKKKCQRFTKNMEMLGSGQ